ncbi:mis18-binding protein 1 isoform X1 [Octopus sinensis]|uniref:Mis18-binding protein 1 isoform X1 n=2 Tax=Octopus sinensis TaxID=2607531 RepID=A0A6P7SLP8_9MOLL|nr:mis18-binding protein 1 isoform X1 [Octopus sinensis]XP_036360461.1 mis18-binding protein 1 isoform X1 [Octopus sinensis]XP_036360462.1 mis18-binding protein 1 isoform X1 [Octopus sinensis]XP_036360463.1 mis18-binding protein 1 isoform X1 [Octopus sinensis]XP_036360464.1 mis18-binding protein 1 isoform X1 [Octopus sinensis]
MNPRHFNMSASNSFMQKHTVDKAFQSLLEESVIYEGPIIHKRYLSNRPDLNLSSARVDLFSSVKNKTFDMGWRQEVAKKSMSFSQNQSHMSSFQTNHSSWRNVSNSHNVGNHTTRVVSKKPTLSPHQESPSVLRKKSPAKISSFKMPPPKNNPSFRIHQHDAKRLEKHLSETSKHNLRSQARDLVTNLQPRVLVKDVRKSGKTSPKKQRASDDAKKTKHRSPQATKDAKDLHKRPPQKKNLVQSMQSHEMVSDIQKQKLRSFAANQKGKYNSESTASSETSSSEDPAVSNKRKRSSPIKSLAEPNPKRQKVPHVKKPDPKAQKSETLTTKPNTKLQIPVRRSLRTEQKEQSSVPKSKSPSKPLPKSTTVERFLDKWIAYEDKNEIFIKGHIKDGSPNTFWRSTPVVRRIENYVLETQSGTNCIISGSPYKSAMLSKGYTQDIINYFKNGFPINWKSLLQRNLPSNSKTTEKNQKLDEERPRKLHDRVAKNLKAIENKTPTPETASTSAENDIPSEKPLQEESSLSDEISNCSDDDELTEMESTATDLLKLLEFRDKNNVFTCHLNNIENSSGSRNSNNYFVKSKNVPQQNGYAENDKSKGRHGSSRSQHKKQTTDKELTMKKQQTVEASLDSESSEESGLSDSDYKDKPKRNRVEKRKPASPSKTRQSSLKRKHLSPTKGVSPKKQKPHNPRSRKSSSPSKKNTKTRVSASSNANTRSTNDESTSEYDAVPVTKGVSPKKQKPHNRRSRKSSSPSKKNTKTRVRASSNANTRSTNDESTSEYDAVSVTKSNKPSKKPGRDSSSRNKTKETSTKSRKSTAEKKKEGIWSDTEMKTMRRAMNKLSALDPKFWSKVAQKVGKSATECRNQYYNHGLQPEKEAQTAKTKKSRKPPEPEADENEAEDPEDDFDDDLFESENVRKKTKNLNFNPEDKLEDIFGDLCAFTPRPSSDPNFQSSMSKFFLTPVSERHTPASSFSDLEVKIDWDNATHCIKNFKKNQKKGAGRLKMINKKLDLQNLQGPKKVKSLDLVAELNKLNDIPMKPKANAVEDSDHLSYFSDSDAN